ncbi:Lysozyme [compost metagenome]
MSNAMVPLLDRFINAGDSLAEDVGGHDDPVDRLCHALTLLFNSTGLSNQVELRSTPHVARSVLNYGLGSFAGVLFSSVDLKQLERRIHALIRDFEPRIVNHTLTVEWLPDVGGYGNFHFLLNGDLRTMASRQAFSVRSSWNTESGEVSVRPWGNCNG